MYINALKDIIATAQLEVDAINNGSYSKWNIDQLVEIVIPEMKELLSYALNDKVFFKYGSSQRLLESSYIISDSLEKLNDTILGRKISEFQTLYDAL